MVFDFFTHDNGQFDKLGILKTFYEQILYPECKHYAKKESSTLKVEAKVLKTKLTESLEALQEEAVKEHAFKVAFASELMLKQIATSEEAAKLDKFTEDTEVLLGNLFVSGEDNAFEDVHNILRKVFVNDMKPIQFHLFKLALEARSIPHIKSLMQDMDLSAEAARALIKAMPYTPTITLSDTLFIDVKENPKEALFFALKHGIIDVFQNLLDKNPKILCSDDDFGFNMGHALAQSAIEEGRVEMLEIIISSSDYKDSSKKINNKPHILVLLDMAMEEDNPDMLELLVPKAEKYLNQMNEDLDPYWFELLQDAVAKDAPDFLHFLLHSEVVGVGLEFYSAAAGLTEEEAIEKISSDLYERACYYDASKAFNVLIQYSREGMLKPEEMKCLIVDIASDLGATKCMQTLDDDFLDEAMSALFEKLEVAKYSENNEAQYLDILEKAKVMLDNVVSVKGIRTINEPITEKGESYLLLSLNLGLVEMARYILDNFYDNLDLQKGAFDMVDNLGRNVIHLAVLNGDVDLLTKLLQLKGSNGAVNNLDGSDHIPLTLAVSEFGLESYDMVKALLEIGNADPLLLGEGDQSAEDLALEISSKDSDLVQLIRNQAFYYDADLENDVFSRSGSFSDASGSEEYGTDSGNSSYASEGETKAKVYKHKKDEIFGRHNSSSSEESYDAGVHQVYTDADGERVIINLQETEHSRDYTAALRDVSEEAKDVQQLTRYSSDSDFSEGEHGHLEGVGCVFSAANWGSFGLPTTYNCDDAPKACSEGAVNALGLTDSVFGLGLESC